MCDLREVTIPKVTGEEKPVEGPDLETPSTVLLLASAGCSACLEASVFLRTASSPAHTALRPACTPLLKATSSRIYKREPQRSHSCQLYPIGHSGRSKSPNQPQLCSRCCPYNDSEPACRISRKENFCRNHCSLAS